VAIYTSAKALSRWPINDESTLTTGVILNLVCNKNNKKRLNSYFLLVDSNIPK
jgi:hypothetical protein